MNTNSNSGYAALVKGYRETVAADPENYDGDLDVVFWLLQDTAGRSWTPSEVGRALKIGTTAAWRLLGQLARGGHIETTGNGSWTRYSAGGAR